MITLTDLSVWSVDCSRCHRPDTIVAYSEDEVTCQLAAEGWRTDPLVCVTCQADEGLTVAEVMSDYCYHQCETGPSPWDRSGL